jgi:formylmethanofuran dehydrogenase subunit B
MSTAELKVVSNATCTFCGCVCDDMEWTVENNHFTEAIEKRVREVPRESARR